MMKLDGLMIWVADVPATVAFYEAAFGVAVQMVDGDQQFAMMDTGATTLQFADEKVAASTGLVVRVNRFDRDAAAHQLTFATDDVPAAFARAVAAGAHPQAQPTTKPWGQTVGYVRDLNGCLIELSSPSD